MTDLPKDIAQTPDLTDALSDVLTAVRFSGGHVESHLFNPSDGVAFPQGERSLLIIRSGSLLLQCNAVGPDPVHLNAGDVVVLAFGSDFSVSCPAEPLGGGLATPGQHATCTWLRGTFHLDAHFSARLLSCLPTIMVLRSVAHGAMDWLETASRFALNEIETPEPGAGIMISRIIELLLIRVLRLWAQEPTAQTSWLLGAADPAISRALTAMHAAPEARWSVPSLAKASRLSRSVFAGRFVSLVGQPPLRYLIGLRLDKAAELLQRTPRSVSEVAEAVGYTSEAAFSRAFKLRFGASPGHWRRR